MCEKEYSTLPIEILTPAEQARLEEKLWQLLANQAQRYTRDESSSLRTEVALELRQSLVYTLGLVLRQQGASPRLLLATDLEQLLRQGQSLLEKLLQETEVRWQAARQAIPQPTSQSMEETLAGFQLFFRAYDYPFFAHHIVADIDYQLALPLPDTWAGVEYVDEYLRRLTVENRLLRFFPAAQRNRLLQAWQPSWQELPLNLYEPVTGQALGLILLDRNPLALSAGTEDRRRLSALLTGLSPALLDEKLQAAAVQLCRLLPGEDPAYTLSWAKTLTPRFSGATEPANVLLIANET